MTQEKSDNMMASSMTRNYHIRDIIYNIYEDIVFKNKK